MPRVFDAIGLDSVYDGADMWFDMDAEETEGREITG